MVSKLFIGLLVGFALGGGMTYYTYGNQLEVMLRDNIGVDPDEVSESIAEISDKLDNTTIPETEPSEIKSKYKDCSVYDFEELPMMEVLKLPDDQQYEYHKKKAQMLTESITCNQYNREIHQAERDKKD